MGKKLNEIQWQKDIYSHRQFAKYNNQQNAHNKILVEANFPVFFGFLLQ